MLNSSETALAKKVVEYAHQFDVTVEAELGVLAGVEDEVVAAESHYTKPEEVIDFATRTGCDSLAISIGTSHGAHKFTPEQCTLVNGVLVPPPLAFDILAEIEKKLPGFPIVLHGSSSVPMEEVETINKFGGKTQIFRSPAPNKLICPTSSQRSILEKSSRSKPTFLNGC